MRIAALSDIHGNLPALEAVLAEVQAASVDRIVVCGDVIPGPMPTQCLDRLRRLDAPIQFLHGNGERAVLEQRSGIDTTLVPAAIRDGVTWVGAQLTDQHVAEIRDWPSTIRITHPSFGRLLFCHATPRNDTEIFTRRTDESVLRPVFAAAEADIVVCGHTHMQFDRSVGATRVINTGSVGMPFGAPGAYWLLITDDECQLRHAVFDLHAAADAVRATAYPFAADFAERNVLAPPTEASILDAFAKVELGAHPVAPS